MLEPGKILGPFRIEQEIGSGAMGTVFRAVFTDTGRQVALKVISTGLSVNESALARFEREGEILKQLRHPNIVRLFATGHYKKTPFLAMEFVNGEPLDVALERRGRLTWEEVVRYGKQLCAALQYAHSKGIIHRDLKPSNLIILKDGTLKLADFGIAKDTDVTALTGNNSTVGTAAYMSPEQCRGERNLTAKSDLYSLGIVFYELLTGEKPFNKDSPVDMFLAHVNDSFERPGRKVLEIPPWLDTLVCQLMEKKPEHRPLDAAMVGKALEEVMDKVGDQRSAGMEMATARAADRSKPIGTNEADREAARILRGAAAKKKIRKRGTAFYERGWFTLLSVALLLGGIGWFAKWAFGPPSAESLYRRAETIMATADYDKAKPVLRQFHDHYSGRDDDHAKKMHEWLVAVEVGELDRGLLKRRAAKMKGDDDRWDAAFAILKMEDAGQLSNARQQWQQMAAKYGSAKSLDEVTWAWLGERHVADLDRRPQIEAALQKHDAKFNSEAEQRSAVALRYEQFGDVPAAVDRWNGIQGDFTNKADSRIYSVIAAAKVQELEPRNIKGADQIQEFRIGLIQQQLAQVNKLRKEDVPVTLRKAHDLCRNIALLYEGDANPKVAEFGKQAATLLKEIPRPPEPGLNKPKSTSDEPAAK